MGTEQQSVSQPNETQTKDINRNTEPLARWLHITYMISLVVLVIGIALLVSPALMDNNISFTDAIQPYFLWATIMSVGMNTFLLIYAIVNKVTANKRAALLSLFSLLVFQLTYFLFVGVWYATCCVAE